MSPVIDVRHISTAADKLCALKAKEINGACKELFDRLVAKGNYKKLAVMAVANKLLKQVFRVIKTETLFDRNYYKNCLVSLDFCTVHIVRKLFNL